MPQFSAYRYGSYSVTIPAYAVNVRLTIGGAGGGGSASTTWNHSRGGNGRVGDFRLATRTSDYRLDFYLGEKGGKGNGPALSGRGAGGRSPVASGGNGHRSGGGGGGASAVYDNGLNRYVITVGGGGGAGKNDRDTGSGYPGASGAGIGGGRTTGTWGHRNGGNAPAGHRGGGGGGADSGGFGGNGGATTTCLLYTSPSPRD